MVTEKQNEARKSSNIDAQIGVRLKSARRDKGISQEMLADRVGLTFQQIQKYENAKNRISCGRIVEFAAILEVPVGYFFGEQTRENKLVETLREENKRLRKTIIDCEFGAMTIANHLRSSRLPKGHGRK